MTTSDRTDIDRFSRRLDEILAKNNIDMLQFIGQARAELLKKAGFDPQRALGYAFTVAWNAALSGNNTLTKADVENAILEEGEAILQHGDRAWADIRQYIERGRKGKDGIYERDSLYLPGQDKTPGEQRFREFIEFYSLPRMLMPKISEADRIEDAVSLKIDFTAYTREGGLSIISHDFAKFVERAAECEVMVDERHMQNKAYLTIYGVAPPCYKVWGVRTMQAKHDEILIIQNSSQLGPEVLGGYRAFLSRPSLEANH